MEVKPTEYFRGNNFNTHLLLLLVMEKDYRALTATVVCDNIVVPDKNGRSQWVREFRELRFEDISEMRREDIRRRRDPEYYEQKDLNIYPHHPGSEIMEGGASPHEHTGYRVGLGCGSFGTYRFRCRTLTVRHRLGKGIQTTANEWDYFDAETGVFFDFWCPFADVSEETPSPRLYSGSGG